MIDLSISIATTDHCDMLRDCLESIRLGTHGIKYEIFVIDSGSTDGTVEMIRRNYPDVHIIQNSIFPGYAAANNQALKASTGRYLCVLNDDTLILDNAFDRLVAYLDDKTDIGAIGPKLLNPDGTHQISSYIGFSSFRTELWTTFRPLALRWHQRFRALAPGKDYFDYYGVFNGDRTSIRRARHLMGACIVVRRETIENIGLLDETFYLSFEDQDWCKRIHDDGWKVVFQPQSKVVHFGNQTVQQLNGFQEVFLGSRFYFQQKHLGSLSAFILKCFHVANCAMGMLKLTLSDIRQGGITKPSQQMEPLRKRRQMFMWLTSQLP